MLKRHQITCTENIYDTINRTFYTVNAVKSVARIYLLLKVRLLYILVKLTFLGRFSVSMMLDVTSFKVTI